MVEEFSVYGSQNLLATDKDRRRVREILESVPAMITSSFKRVHNKRPIESATVLGYSLGAVVGPAINYGADLLVYVISLTNGGAVQLPQLNTEYWVNAMMKNQKVTVPIILAFYGYLRVVRRDLGNYLKEALKFKI